MPSFFIRKKGVIGKRNSAKAGNKRKTGPGANSVEFAKKLKKPSQLDEEIPSDTDSDSNEEEHSEGKTSEDDPNETAQEKKLRLARKYLGELAKEEAEKHDLDEVPDDLVGQRLKDEALEAAGKLQRQVAHTYDTNVQQSDIQIVRGHRRPLTCVVLLPNNKIAFTGSKDGSIIKWDVTAAKRLYVMRGRKKGTVSKERPGHSGHVLCLAASSDGKFLASGCSHKAINIWDPETCAHLHSFSGHREAVSGLAFRKGTHTLFSTSNDRTVKIWSVEEMVYVETLFGHQAEITACDSLSRDRAITAGGRDNTVRIWKVPEESQLVFNGHGGSIDCVRLINEEHFVSGSDDGSLCVWNVRKKRPLVTRRASHGTQSGDFAQNNWVTSVAALLNTDLIASGSSDGWIRLWKAGEEFRSLGTLFEIKVDGFVNGLQFSSDGQLLVAAVGQEHRLGRWWHLHNVHNSLCFVHLHRKDISQNGKSS